MVKQSTSHETRSCVLMILKRLPQNEGPACYHYSTRSSAVSRMVHLLQALALWLRLGECRLHAEGLHAFGAFIYARV